MRIITCLLIIICYLCSCHTKRDIKEYIPNLLTDPSEFPIIYNNTLTDSFRINYKVIVEFKYPFEDTLKDITVHTVSLNEIIIVSMSDSLKEREEVYDYDKKTPFQMEIWKICDNKIPKWYKSQPYEKYPYRYGTGRRVMFYGRIYLKPDKK